MLVKSAVMPRYTVSQQRPVISSRWGLLAPRADESTLVPEQKDFTVQPDHEGFVLEDRHLSADVERLLNSSPEFSADIFRFGGDLLVKNSLSAACSMLLKILGQKLHGLQRGMMLTVRHGSGQLIPQNIYYFDEHHEPSNRPCKLVMSAMERAMEQKRGVFLSAEEHPDPSQVHVLVMPVLAHEEVILLIHLEMERKQPLNLPRDVVAFAGAIISRLAPTFDSLILREDLDSWVLNSVNSMMTALEAKDTYTAGHSERVCRYSMAIADELHLDRDTKQLLMISSLCHDIGKIGTPDHILKNSASLTHEQYEEIKHHPGIGDKIIHHLPNYHKIMGGVRHHHERLDGTGYPDGLRGDEIPLFGRIVAIADAFDAMVSGRSYSGFLEDYDAVEKLSKERDAFDPHILKAFGRSFNSGVLSLRTGTIKRYIGEG